MKHVDVINKIIEAEQQAQDMAGQAKEKQSRLNEELRDHMEDMRQKYLKQAENRVSRVREQESTQCQEEIQALAETQKKDMADMERLYRLHKEEWVETIFQKVIDL